MAYLQAESVHLTVSLAANVAKTVNGIKGAAQQAIKILEYLACHDGNTSGNTPDITDFARSNFATNAPSVGSPTNTSQTPQKKDPGRGETVQTVAAQAWTSGNEPTGVTAFRSINLAQYNGLYHHIVPFAAPMICVGGSGFLIRHNSPNTVNCTGAVEFEE